METPRKLKINYLKNQNEYSRQTQIILADLRKIDNNAEISPVEQSIAGRELIKQFWDLLPEENQSHCFENVSDQTVNGRILLPATDFTQKINLHLGWDILSFTCSLLAAWQQWEYFSSINTDTYNCCIFPDSLEWYVIRAGNNLYPMKWSGTQYELTGLRK